MPDEQGRMTQDELDRVIWMQPTEAQLKASRALAANTNRAYGYCRISTLEQGRSGLSLEAQTQTIREYVRHRGFTFMGNFTDVEGAHDTPLGDRKEGRKLCQALARGDHVVFAKYDRGFPNLPDTFQMSERWLARSITTHLLDWKIDSSMPFWKLLPFHRVM